MGDAKRYWVPTLPGRLTRDCVEVVTACDYDALAFELAETRQERDIVRDNNDLLGDDNKALRARLAEAERLAIQAINALPCPTHEKLARALDAKFRSIFGRDTLGRLTASADDVINAQHDETGRTWRGPRSQLPRRYFEITSICCLDYPLCDCNSPPEPDDDWLCFQRPAQPKVTP